MKASVLFLVLVLSNFAAGDGDKESIIARYGRNVDQHILDMVKDHEDFTKRCRERGDKTMIRVKELLAEKGIVVNFDKHRVPGSKNNQPKLGNKIPSSKNFKTKTKKVEPKIQSVENRKTRSEKTEL